MKLLLVFFAVRDQFFGQRKIVSVSPRRIFEIKSLLLIQRGNFHRESVGVMMVEYPGAMTAHSGRHPTNSRARRARPTSSKPPMKAVDFASPPAPRRVALTALPVRVLLLLRALAPLATQLGALAPSIVATALFARTGARRCSVSVHRPGTRRRAGSGRRTESRYRSSSGRRPGSRRRPRSGRRAASRRCPGSRRRRPGSRRRRPSPGRRAASGRRRIGPARRAAPTRRSAPARPCA